jgi:hypothetical protein
LPAAIVEVMIAGPFLIFIKPPEPVSSVAVADVEGNPPSRTYDTVWSSVGWLASIMPGAGLPRQSRAVVRMTERPSPIDESPTPPIILPKKLRGTIGKVLGARCLLVSGGKIKVG